jgi:hypothetical protein
MNWKLVPVEPTPEMIENMKAAIEGECDGLSITDHHARAILDYVIDAAPAPAVDGLEVVAFPQVDYDAGIDRWYIPVHEKWEIQTKGNGSSFRIAKRDESGDRWLVCDNHLHAMLEEMARDIHARQSDAARLIAERDAVIERKIEAIRMWRENYNEKADIVNRLESNNAELRARLVDMEKARTEPVACQYQSNEGRWYPFSSPEHYERTVESKRRPVRAIYTLPPDSAAIIADLQHMNDTQASILRSDTAQFNELRAEVERLTAELADANERLAALEQDAERLIAIGAGRIAHVNNGMCPDSVEGHDTRDPDCPACRVLIAAGYQPAHKLGTALNETPK